jgi:hypothetical protein
LGADTFSARWTGYLLPQESGRHQFTAYSDNGIRLWVNNQLVLDSWITGGIKTRTSSIITLTAGQLVPFRVEYFHTSGPAVMTLLWRTATMPLQLVSAGRFFRDQPAPLAAASLAVAPQSTPSLLSALGEVLRRRRRR